MSNNPQTEAELTMWRNGLKVGDTVVTNRFETYTKPLIGEVKFLDEMNNYVGVKGKIKGVIWKGGALVIGVHGFSWPLTALTPVPVTQPVEQERVEKLKVLEDNSAELAHLKGKWVTIDFALSELMKLQSELDKYKSLHDELDAIQDEIVKENILLKAENEALKNPWISIEDRLPEFLKTVLLRFVDDRPFMENEPPGHQIVFRDHDGFFYMAGMRRINHKVTHWMPLPSPPNV